MKTAPRSFHHLLWGLTLLTVFAAPGAAGAESWDFDTSALDALPEGFVGSVGEWAVVRDEAAPSGEQVLAQRGRSWISTFNVALVQGSTFAEVDLSVKVRTVSGRIDRGGGLVWRAVDEGNYYVARWNPLEDNYRVYFVKDGERQQIQSADVRVDADAWHTLRVTMRGDHIQCFLDGTKHLDVRDATFRKAGMIGLWTKADARTNFDDLEVAPAKLKHAAGLRFAARTHNGG